MHPRNEKRLTASVAARWAILGLAGTLLLGLLAIVVVIGNAIADERIIPSWIEPLASALAGAAIVMLTFEIVRIEYHRNDQDQPIFFAYEAATFVFDRATGNCTMDFWVLNKGARASAIETVIVDTSRFSCYLEKIVKVIEDEDGIRELPGGHLIESGARLRFRSTQSLPVNLVRDLERFDAQIIAKPVYGRALSGWALFKTQEAYLKDEGFAQIRRT